MNFRTRTRMIPLPSCPPSGSRCHRALLPQRHRCRRRQWSRPAVLLLLLLLLPRADTLPRAAPLTRPSHPPGRHHSRRRRLPASGESGLARFGRLHRWRLRPGPPGPRAIFGGFQGKWRFLRAPLHRPRPPPLGLAGGEPPEEGHL